MKTSVKTRVMDFVQAQGGSARFTDIQRFMVEVICGRKYDKESRGHFTSAFRNSRKKNPTGYFLRPGHETRFLVKAENGIYYLKNN